MMALYRCGPWRRGRDPDPTALQRENVRIGRSDRECGNHLSITRPVRAIPDFTAPRTRRMEREAAPPPAVHAGLFPVDGEEFSVSSADREQGIDSAAPVHAGRSRNRIPGRL